MKSKGYLVLRLLDPASLRPGQANVEFLGEFLRLRDAEVLVGSLNGGDPAPKRKAWVKRITLSKE